MKILKQSQIRGILTLFCGVILISAFSISLHQRPLYYFNQNTYFLHPLAQCDIGFLKEDWFSQTADPFPLFSWLTCSLLKVFSESAFYFTFMILAGVFIFSLMGIISTTFKFEKCRLPYLIVFFILLLLYSGVLAELQMKIPLIRRFPFIFDPNGILTWGVADQYLLGEYLQPSVFGVFLLTSIYCFLIRKNTLAVLFLALAATFHSTYLLAASVITTAYLIIIYQETRDIKIIFRLGVTALIFVLPVILYDTIHFHPTNASIYYSAQEILVRFRIPHHALPSAWMDQKVFIQIGIILLALLLVRRTRLFPILLVSFIAAVALTFLQILTQNLSLALLFPWRISVYLVPISSAIIISSILIFGLKLLQKTLAVISIPLQVIIILVTLALGVTGLKDVRELIGSRDQKLPRHLRFIQSDFQPGDLYLIPPDLQSFRLEAGIPVLTDLKSNPYQDTEVLEWYERNQIALAFYSSSQAESCDMIVDLQNEYGITHVLLARTSNVDHLGDLQDCPLVKNAYEDSYYTVYEIIKP